jgi:uridylate kinase
MTTMEGGTQKNAFRRVLLKLSGQALAGDGQKAIDPESTRELAQHIGDVRERGVELARSRSARSANRIFAGARSATSRRVAW